jgi:hypothetical protein
MEELITVGMMIVVSGISAAAAVDAWTTRLVAMRKDDADWTDRTDQADREDLVDGWARLRMERSAWVRRAIPGMVRAGVIRFFG